MGYNSSILKSLALLDCFQSDREEFGISDFSSLTGQPESTVQRLINSLEFAGMLYQNPYNKKYRLSLRALRPLSSQNAAPLWLEQAKAAMKVVNDVTDETVNLGIRIGSQLEYIAKQDSNQLLRPNFILGTKYPLYCTGLGRCLLAYMDREDIQELFPEPLIRPIDQSPLSLDTLYETIVKTREQGYYLDDEEFSLGLYCIAVPVFAFPKKVIAAISVSVPKVRITPENTGHILNTARQAADTISQSYAKIIL
ncbi:IclR family transcriptional regulator [uncultured Megasphaera sp.]|uniref:IclR family transcriptional regulator n=1 Tax=uncultured Megasphaera sp. TaxID=165188 RepID=UPI00265AAF84|nr:IclR family transcriptional regulator [uncultured Megasphaera sp.]